MLEQRFHAASMLRIQRYADTGQREQRLISQQVRPAECVANLDCHVRGMQRQIDIVQQYYEFIAPDARYCVRLSHAGLQPARNFLQ